MDHKTASPSFLSRPHPTAAQRSCLPGLGVLFLALLFLLLPLDAKCEINWDNDACGNINHCDSTRYLNSQSSSCTNGRCICNTHYYGRHCSHNYIIKATPDMPDFGKVIVGESKSITITVYTGTMIHNMLISTTNSDYEFNPLKFNQLNEEAERSIKITFSPTSAGVKDATLTISGRYSSAGSTSIIQYAFTKNIAIKGTGILATRDIVMDAQDSAILYAGLDGGGVYKSTDGGENWTAASSRPANTRVMSRVQDPTDSSRLSAATYGGGVYVSADSAENWAACTSTPNLNLVSLTVDAAGKIVISHGVTSPPESMKHPTAGHDNTHT